MKAFKDFFNLTNVVIILFAVGAASFLYLYATVYIHNQHLQEYLIDIAAACFAIIPTVVVVNYLSDTRWESARNTTQNELKTLVDQHLRQIVIPWGYLSEAGSDDQLTQSLTVAHRKQYFKVVSAKLMENDSKSEVHGFGPDEWRTLRKNTLTLEPLVARFLALHSRTISPENHGDLLELQSKLEKINHALAIEDGALTTPLNEWEERMHFAASRYANAARQRISNNASKALFEYLTVLLRFKSK